MSLSIFSPLDFSKPNFSIDVAVDDLGDRGSDDNNGDTYVTDVFQRHFSSDLGKVMGSSGVFSAGRANLCSFRLGRSQSLTQQKLYRGAYE